MTGAVRFEAPGPISGAFLASRAPVRAIMGPQGSAKTSSCLWDIVYKACQQRQSPIDGRRYFKAGVVRDTYPNLDGTTIPSWHKWFPKTMGAWSGDAPRRHGLLLEIPGLEGEVDLQIEFIALGALRVEDVLRGWEGNLLYLNEADRLTEDVLTYAFGRVDGGRYPAMHHGGSSWNGVTCDFNAPDIDNWTYPYFVEAPRPGVEFYRQPSGLSPQAENLQNLAPGTYERLAATNPEWWVRRFVKNEFGYSREGLPVYSEFSDGRMVAARPLEPVRGLPLLLGADAGGTPALVIRQHLPNGQRRVLDELVSDPDEFTGSTRFGEMINRLLAERYAGWPKDLMTAWADPSSVYGADTKQGEKSWLDTVSAVTGVRFRPAATNDPNLRREAVRLPMKRTIDGDQPAFLMSPRCRVLRFGYNSGYRFKRKAGANGVLHDEPEKNRWSHVADADQYAALGDGEHLDVLGRRRATSGPRQTQAITDEQPRGVWEGARGGRQASAVVE